MNYWLHRIKGGSNALPLASKLFEKGILSIGFCDFSSEDDLKAIKSGRSQFDQMFEGCWGDTPRTRQNLWRFVNEMKEGDIVVVPFPYEFTVCKILDEKIYTNETIDLSLLFDWDNKPVNYKEGYLYDSDNQIVDLGFYRRIEIIQGHISRLDYAKQDLYSRLKIRQTNANINDIKLSVDEAVSRAKENVPLKLKNDIINNTRQTVLQSIHSIQNDKTFENLVGWYLHAIGGHTIEMPAKNESPTECGDADRVAYFDDLKVAVMVQIKKHSDITDDWAIKQIKAYRKNHSDDDYKSLLWVISTCDDYSQEAKRLAQEEGGVRLITGGQFAEMVLNVGLSGLDL